MNLEILILKRILSYLLVFLGFSTAVIYGQQPMKIGDWATYLPKREGAWVTQSDQKIYYSTKRSILIFDKNDLSFVELSKMDGLSETVISKIKFDKFNKQLIVIYESGGIDIVSDEGVYTISDIKDNKNIIGRKNINDIFILDENTAYLSTDFGIVEWDLKALEFRFTTFTSFPVYAVSASNTHLFAATDDGLFKIRKDDISKINFSRWEFLSGRANLPASYDSRMVAFFNGKVYTTVNKRVFVSDNGNIFAPLSVEVGFSFEPIFMTTEGAHLLIGYRDNNVSSLIKAIDKNGNVLPAGGNCANRVLYGIEDEKSRVWFADMWRLFRFTTAGLNEGCQMVEFDSPLSFETSQIEVKNDRVFFASGGASIDNYALLSNRNGVYVLQNDEWLNLAGPFFNTIDQNDFLNFLSVAPHPTEDKIYAASFYSGIMIYDFEKESFEFLNNTKLPITNRVAFVKFDKNGNLWATAYLSPKPIFAGTPDGNWYSFVPPIANKAIAKIAFDDRNYKWFTVIGNPGGVLVLDDGERINDPSDDRYRYFDQSNSVLEGGSIYSIQADQDGEIWVGTNEGPVVFDCDPFDENCKGNVIKVLQDIIAAILLKTEDILSIEFDGGNRKWFGTRNGIFVQSADAINQVLRFTTTNSPLLDNTVVSLKFDQKSGVMYIGTAQGIQAYQTETVGAKARHSEEVYAFPNPVRPGYEGTISVRGLGRDANVKITDINGKLVYETTALGGQANWDGRDYTGRKAAPGVYLVFSASRVDFESVDSYVTKILIVN